MFNALQVERSRPYGMALEEWVARLELAACYRVFEHKGWAEEIFNHITVKVPGTEPSYLINPFGLTYGEVTARNLVKVDLAGNPLHPTDHPVNRAGFVIHSAIHAARADAHCVMHTHNSYGVAVACKPQGLEIDNFYAAFVHDKLAYHDFEGVTVNEGEQGRLVASLGDKSCLILRSHGLLVAERSVSDAYYWMYALQRACEVQVLASTLRGPNIPVSEAARQVSSRDNEKTDPQGHLYAKVFAAAVRRAGLTLEELAAV
jgi:ribulose-5-phosphate 4-epimerase/fuculose-1-phosphate aldolase